MIVFTIDDLETVSETNRKGHEHWRKSAARHDVQKLATRNALKNIGDRCVLALPLDVTVVRIAPGRGLDPFENLPSSMKYIVDEIAKWLGVDDRRDDIVRYTARQEKPAKGAKVQKAVRVEIRERIVTGRAS